MGCKANHVYVQEHELKSLRALAHLYIRRCENSEIFFVAAPIVNFIDEYLVDDLMHP